MNAVALAIKITADGKAAGSAIDGVTQKTSKLGKAGKAAGRLLAAGLVAGVAAAGAAVRAAAEDETAQTRLASALKNATGAREKDIAGVEKWISAQGMALGVSDDQLRPSLEALVSATKDVAKAQDLASIAMDIAARKGESVESVSKKLAKAYATGNVGALAKYGVATKNAEGKTRKLGAVQADLAKLYKGAATDSANTAAGAQAKLSVRVDELKEKYGAKLLPVLLAVVGVGLKVVDWIDRNEKAAAIIIGTLAGLLAIVRLVSIATTVWSTVVKIATGVQAAFNLVMAANPIVLVVVAVVALAAAFVIAYKRSETFRNIVNKVASSIAKAFGAAVSFIKDNWEKLLIGLTGPLGLAVVLIVKNWDKIRSTAEKAWDKIKAGFVAVKTKVEEISGTVRSLLEAAFKPIDTAIGFVTTLISKIESLISKIKSIPTPDVNVPFLRTANRGGTGTASDIRSGMSARGGAQVINISVTVPGGFVGDDAALARKIRGLLASDIRRLTAA